ncbi:MAG: ATP synthase F0 subunit B/F-type H+-transporting ATPase subunit b [Treponematales bacterium]
MIEFSFSTFLVTIINVVVLFLVLRAVLFKPVTAFMEARTAKVRGELEAAGREREAAQALFADYQKRLGDAEGEALALLAEARNKAGKEAERIVAQGKAAAEEAMETARKRIEQETRTAWAELRKDAAGLVTAAAGKLAARDFSASDDRQYAESLIAALAAPEGQSAVGRGHGVS